MSDVLKNEIIARAASVFGLGFAEMIHSALLTYRRRPGLGDLVRIYEGAVGRSAYLGLIQALEVSSVEKFYPAPGCLQIREQLHWHILRHLQLALIRDGQASGAMRDSSFGGDLGL
ncbi:hypothetical protein PSCICO_17360 [Pseudomonas cichorii]|uniref:hypothetical protein n=1 Tax=Pseudomonas cichorii TaxID=36746 RepID=UPI0019101FE1|nr:hypothetical protein [Pseudomonas cichorii]GFM86337.1 hypothetical protein PSCICO_17360 [Pseudomonas cichorii]